MRAAELRLNPPAARRSLDVGGAMRVSASAASMRPPSMCAGSPTPQRHAILAAMIIRESIEIEAPPEEVWPQIADPERMAAWHVKLLSVRRSGRGTVRLGDRFETTYTMSGRQLDASAEVIRCQPPAALTLRHHLPIEGRQRYVDESFDLTAVSSGTRVDQAVNFRAAGLPWWARLVIRLITWFGQPTGPGILAPLKMACEGGSAAH